MKFYKYENKVVLLFMAFLLMLFFLFSCSNQENSAQKYMKSANAYMDAKEYKKAEIELRNVLQTDPKNENAYVKLSEVYRQLNNPKKELVALIQVIDLNPVNMDAQHRLAQVYLLGNQTKKARKTAGFILEKEPENIRALHLLATAQVQERNVNAALKTLTKAIEIEPENPNLYTFLGYLFYYGKNEFNNSENAYKKALSLDRNLSEPYEELVRIYTLEKRFDKAESLLIDWTDIPGNLQQKYVFLAGFYESQEEFKRAEAIYFQLIKISDKNDSEPLYTLALFYARTKAFQKAVEMFKRTLFIGNRQDVQAALANVYFDMKDYRNAQVEVSDILEKDSNHTRARLLECKLLIVQQSYVIAFEKLEQLIAIDKNIGEAYYLKALCLVEKNLEVLPAQEIRMAATGDLSVELWKRNMAIDSLRIAIELATNYFTARMFLADLYLKNNNFVQADKQLDYILKRFPNHTNALLMFGNLKIQRLDWDIAQKVFLRLVDKNPNLSLAHMKLGLIYNSLKQPEKAVDSYKKALKIEPTSMKALGNIVSVYMVQNQKESALKILNNHINHQKITQKEKGHIYFLLGKILLSTGDTEQAVKYFNTSIMTFAQTTPSYEALAAIEENKGNFFKAVKYYELILSYNPDFLPAYLALSRIYQRDNNLSKSKETLNKILKIQDDFAPAANDLAYLLAEEGQHLQNALHLARIAESKDQLNPNYIDTLGWVYYKQKAYELAIHKLQKSLEINPDIPLTHYHLGWAYYDTGRYENARDQMRQALKLSSDFEGADKARDLIGE